MRFEFKNGDDIVAFSGDLTFTDHLAFREVADRLAAAPGKKLVIELSGLTFVDSAGLGMLLIARDEATKANRSVVLRGAQGQVQRMFTLTKFDKLFTVEA
jgi:HptB-dependent secretion and biofilm anti anti-sigma factor